ncbi:MAG: Mov34/MPN/PAD-1 family protein [Desulfuromonadales bacterium]|nr:Mov34/MPN/PAD-1 family protein [Desulfuromonadales bacterium]MDW7756159.1 Mov34/MPN/PAD-1 family protein [Desulfuromonadales bacterium]
MKRIWINNNVYQEMLDEANDKAPLETGGLLVGYFSRDNTEIVATGMVGPGLNAVHGECFFSPDEDYQREEMGRIYDEKDGQIFYLGDWHTHPSGPGILSGKDKKALRNIARFPDNYVDNPSMLVLYGNVNQWRPRAWRISGSPFFLFCSYLDLDVVFYNSRP